MFRFMEIPGIDIIMNISPRKSGPSPWGASEGRAPNGGKCPPPPDAQVEYNDNFIGKPMDFNHVK